MAFTKEYFDEGIYRMGTRCEKWDELRQREGGDILPIANESELPVTAQVIVPVVAGGDCLGAVVLLATDEGAVMEASAVKMARLTSDIIAGQFE